MQVVSAATKQVRPTYTARCYEWPTLGLLVANDAALAALVAFHRHVPTVVLVACLAVLGAAHMSLQHEALHGHPTPHQWLNELLVTVPSFLWLSFPAYRDSHRLHHRIELTRPGVDPESFYVDQHTWDRSCAVWRLVLRANRTLLGRMVLWPPIAMVRGVTRLAADAVCSGRGAARAAGHVVASAITVWLICILGGLPWWLYVVGFLYGGLSITYVRSFAEHLPVVNGSRSAVVRTNRFMSLLFLNNNLHHTHHAAPDIAWYRLPQTAELLRSDELAAAGAGLYMGYGELFRRHLIRPFSQPIHPQS